MGSAQRWGKKFVDKRDWVKYNEELVIRGEFLLDCEWVKSWKQEIDEMNKGKVGAGYRYPNSMMRFQAVLHQWIEYRGLEGLMRQLVEFGQLPRASDFSNVCKRVNRLGISFTLPKNDCTVTCDGSGMKFENAGEYRARMYGKKRKKYIKVVITADPNKKKLLNCEVSIEGEGKSEPKIAEEHMKELLTQGITITKFLGDGSFDTLELFAFLEKNKIKPAIKPRENAVESGKNTLRDKEIKAFKRLGYMEWARSRDYGRRWTGTEGIFSAVKRKFGEQTRSHKIENALNEVKRKFWAYDRMKAYAEARV